MARSGQPIEQFDMQGRVAQGYANEPIDNGQAAQAFAQVFSGIGARLGKMADQAAALAGAKDGAAASADAIGLPSSEVIVKTTAGTPAVAGGKPVKISGSVTGKASIARAYYEKLGYTPEQASGIVGNLMQESTLNTGAVGDRSIPGASIGIGQWNRERQANLQAFAASRGKPLSDFETQLAFVHHELQTTEGAAGAALKKAKTVEAATTAMIGFERPQGWTAANPQAGHGFANRLAYAQQVHGGAVSEISLAGVPAAAATPAIVDQHIQFHIPDPKPLALRNDSTIYGQAYDTAAAEGASWRLSAGLDAALNNAYDENKKDPVAFQKIVTEIGQAHVKQASAIDPMLGEKMAQRVVDRSEAYFKNVNALNDQRVNEERKVSAIAALDSQDGLIERQAYALGTTQDGDAQLQKLSQGALTAIDAAQASGAIDAGEAQNKRQATLEKLTISRMKGVFDALPDAEQKKHFAASLMDEWKANDSPLGAVSLSRMEGLVNEFDAKAAADARQAKATSAFDKAQLGRLIGDDVSSISRTGVGVAVGGQPIDYATVAKTFGEDKAQAWLEDKAFAKQAYDATNGLEHMHGDDMAQRLADLEPKAGETGYEAKAKIFDEATKQADKILKLRNTDPALAAEDAYPELTQITDPVERAHKRMDAQSALGIFEAGRNPLTRQEAQAISGRINLVEDNPDALDAEMRAIMNDTQKTYGTLADDVMAQVLGETGIRKQTAQAAIGMMNELNIGRVPDSQMIQNYSAYRRADMAHAAMDGTAAPAKVQSHVNNPAAGMYAARLGNQKKDTRKAELPNAAHVSMLKSNPQLAAQFDQRFGQGSAETFLADHGEPIRRKLANGDVQMQYADGFIEVMHVDGSFSGEQAQ
jgi:Phage tail lysozyme